MKQFIVMTAMIALGVFLYGLIAGREDGSVINALAGVWRTGVAVRTYSP